MNIYKRKLRWKFVLFIFAIIIGVCSLWYTNKMVNELAQEERKKVELWAEATKEIVEADVDKDNFAFLLKVIENNNTVPVIVVDSANRINTSRNLDTSKINQPKYLQKCIVKMAKTYDPIRIQLPGDNFQLIYYDKSTILSQLIYYPIVQLGVILMFILVAYLAFSNSRKAEQNQVWIGLSKETAHQLGTPISSLMAWNEMLKQQNIDPSFMSEFAKDVHRLEIIAERFSKIGSKPKLELHNIQTIIQNGISYIKKRASQKITINFSAPDYDILVPINPSLFEWVVENLSKNAMDAMNGSGEINISIHDNTQIIYVDFEDQGKGIPKSNYKSIFKPGYTTKELGWGLGLSLAKRIVEEYHHGKIFVLSSDQGKGTKMRIVLNKFV